MHNGYRSSDRRPISSPLSSDRRRGANLGVRTDVVQPFDYVAGERSCNHQSRISSSDRTFARTSALAVAPGCAARTGTIHGALQDCGNLAAERSSGLKWGLTRSSFERPGGRAAGQAGWRRSWQRDCDSGVRSSISSKEKNMSNPSKFNVYVVGASTLALLLTTSAFAESRHHDRTGRADQPAESHESRGSRNDSNHWDSSRAQRPSDRGFDQSRGHDRSANRGFDQGRGYDRNTNRGYDQSRGYDRNANRGFDQNRGLDTNRGFDANRGFDRNNNRSFEHRDAGRDFRGSR